MQLDKSTAYAFRLSLAFSLAAGSASGADRFEMLPSDTDPSLITPFRMLEDDAPPPASQQTIFSGNSSAGSDAYETGPDQAIIFRDTATASSASIVNNGGQTLFENASTAQASTLSANGKGFIRFSGTSNAADAVITVNDGGLLEFDEDATAGGAKVTANASMRFAGRSTAANSSITVNGTGVVAFDESATAGEAQIANSGSTGFFGSSTLGGGTIINNETGFVYFADDSNAGDDASFISNSGTVVFADRSNLADGAITSNETGTVRFEDDSGAGTGFISSGGAVVFTDRSSAEQAEIVGNEGGLVLFRDDSTAGDATISGASDVRFAGRSTAGNASITMGDGATASFTEAASGGTARFQLDAGSALDIAAADNQINIGSLGGAGEVRLGRNTLGVGDATPLATFAGTISDGGAGGGLTKRGTGTLNLSGESDYSGATTVEQGTLEAGVENVFASRSAFTVEAGATLALAGFDQEIGSLAGAGTVDVSAESVLTTGGNGTSTIFSGIIAGSGGLVKDGTGEFTLTGDSTYTGDTQVVAGLMRVDGDISSSSFSVGPLGTLAGAGRIGSTTVSGTLLGEAGGQPLTIDGGLTLAGTATTVIEVSGAQAGGFAVTGEAALGGALTVRSSGTIPPGFEHVFLTAGSITGEYDEVNSDFAFYDASVVYGDTSATLSLDRNDVSFVSVADTRNQRATAGAIEELGDRNAVFDAVLPLSENAARAAFDNLSGEGHASALGAIAATQAAARYAVLGALRDENGPAVWGDIQASSSRQQSDGNGGETELTSYSIVSGADIVSSADRRFGVYSHLSRSDLSNPDRATSGDIEAAGLGVYGAWTPDPWRVRGGAGISYNAIELERRISVGALEGKASSDYPGWAASAFGEVAYAVDAAGVSFEPYLGLAFTHAWTGGFDEGGAQEANLSSDGSDYSRLDAEIGVRTSHSFLLQNGVMVRPTVGVGYVRNVAGSVATSTHNFAGGQSFEVAAARLGRDNATVDVRIEIAFSHRIEADLFYRGLLSDADYSQLVGAGLRVAF